MLISAFGDPIFPRSPARRIRSWGRLGKGDTNLINGFIFLVIIHQDSGEGNWKLMVSGHECWHRWSTRRSRFPCSLAAIYQRPTSTHLDKHHIRIDSLSPSCRQLITLYKRISLKHRPTIQLRRRTRSRMCHAFLHNTESVRCDELGAGKKPFCLYSL